MNALILPALLGFASPGLASDGVAIREQGEGRFSATLSSTSEMTIDVAQARLMGPATKACRGVTPRFGRYRFESTRPVSSTTPDPRGERFDFVQEFTCGAESAVPPMLAARSMISDKEIERRVAEVVSRTRTLLASANAHMLEDVHATFSAPLAEMLPLPRWMDEQTSLHRSAGAITSDPQLRATSYIDPQGAPVPGVYIAIDFEASYARAPHRCGSIMWLVDRDSRIWVIRLEDGIISSELKASLTPGELAEARQQLRCIVP